MTQTTDQTSLTDTLIHRVLGVAFRSGFQIRQPALGTRLRAMGTGIPGLDVTAETEPVSQEQLAALVSRLMGQIVVGAQQAEAALGDRRLSWTEASVLAGTLLTLVSTAVHEGAPLIQDADARSLVLLIYGAVFERFVMPRLPAWLRPFAPFLKMGVVQGLEAIYRAVVKRVHPAPTPTS